MNDETKERVSTLEVVLGRHPAGEFIVQTNKSLNRLEKEIHEIKERKERYTLKDENHGFKYEINA